MLYCAKCGAENKDQAKFCRNCGAPLKKPKVQQKTYSAGNIHNKESSGSNYIIITVIAIIAVAVVVGAFFILNSNPSGDNVLPMMDDSAKSGVNVGNEKINIPSEFHITSADQQINTYNELTSHYINYYYAYFKDDSGNKIYVDVAEFSNGDSYTDSTLDTIYQFKGKQSNVNGEYGYYISNGKYKYCFVYAKNNKVIGIASNNPHLIEEIV